MIILGAKEIKELREKLGYTTQADFAAKLGVRPLTVLRWENGQASPSRMASEKLLRLVRKKEAQDKEREKKNNEIL